MGATTPRPTAGGTGQPTPPNDSSAGGSDYYRHLLENQREKAADVDSTRRAQNQPQQPPNRPGPNLPGFGMGQQGQVGPQGSGASFQGAYDAYIQQFGGNAAPPPQQGAMPPSSPQQRPPADRQGFDQNRSQQQPRRPGIRMGAGYANRD